MTHAMVFDAVRTPRGKGKRDGSLHSVKPVDLLGACSTNFRRGMALTPLKSMMSSWAVSAP